MLSGNILRSHPTGYLDETVTAMTFRAHREMQLRADAFLVLKGSMGTLAELALVWNLSKIDVNSASRSSWSVRRGGETSCALDRKPCVTAEEMSLLHSVPDLSKPSRVSWSCWATSTRLRARAPPLHLDE